MFHFIERMPRTSGTISSIVLLYATGFLITRQFHDSYSIRSADSDVFRLHYLNVGFIYCLTVLIVVFPTICLLETRRQHKLLRQEIAKELPEDEKTADRIESEFKSRLLRRWRMTYVGIIHQIILISIFYFVVLLAPPGTFRNIDLQVCLFVPLAIVFSYRRWVLSRIGTRGRNERHGRLSIFILILLFIALALVTSYRWEDLALVFKNDAWWGGVWFVTSAIMMSVIVGRISTLHREFHDTKARQLSERYSDISHRAAFQTILLISVLYFNLSAYAHGVYAFIPSSRAGGDVSFSPNLVFQRAIEANRPSDLEVFPQAPDSNARVGTTVPLVLIDQTETSFFVAAATEKGGPANWRFGRGQKPYVWEIQKTPQVIVRFDPTKKAESESPVIEWCTARFRHAFDTRKTVQ